ncbi:sulfotransferase family protein [Nocardioides sp. Leaf285]|uniref:sulfotransferase family protein n=1 Tax=Nocardioides sp. Leaf285 TaxID=1736322 RepID=UPI000703A3A2|nr:sulfotransferase [Nocardioides sp. Leaf285]KQP64522.1 hypothetical protein ASF47_11225 [Nocardioides sp. Leaf285]
MTSYAAARPTRPARPDDRGDAGPLFVLGAPRSGTSLVYRALALHPRAGWVSNYHRRLPALPELGALGRVARLAPERRRAVWFGPGGDDAYRYASRRSLAERFFPQPVEGEPVFVRRGALPGAAPGDPAVDVAGLVRDLERLRRSAGAAVVVSKRIDHNRRVPLLAEAFPRARFVVVTRDGRAVTRSLTGVDWWPDLELWWDGGARVLDRVAQGADPAELAARHWLHETEALDAGLAGLDPGRVRHVGYEELVRDPVAVLGATARFAGLGEYGAWAEELRRLSYPDRNRSTREVPVGVARILAPSLARHGYR